MRHGRTRQGNYSTRSPSELQTVVPDFWIKYHKKAGKTAQIGVRVAGGRARKRENVAYFMEPVPRPPRGACIKRRRRSGISGYYRWIFARKYGIMIGKPAESTERGREYTFSAICIDIRKTDDSTPKDVEICSGCAAQRENSADRRGGLGYEKNRRMPA